MLFFSFNLVSFICQIEKKKKIRNQKDHDPVTDQEEERPPVWAPAWGHGCQVSPPWVTLLPLCTPCFWKEVTMHSSHLRSGELWSTSFREQWRRIFLFMRCNAALEIKQQRRMCACLTLSVYNACFPLLVAWTTWMHVSPLGPETVTTRDSVSDGLEGPQTLRVRSP